MTRDENDSGASVWVHQPSALNTCPKRVTALNEASSTGHPHGVIDNVEATASRMGCEIVGNRCAAVVDEACAKTFDIGFVLGLPRSQIHLRPTLVRSGWPYGRRHGAAMDKQLLPGANSCAIHQASHAVMKTNGNAAASRIDRLPGFRANRSASAAMNSANVP